MGVYIITLNLDYIEDYTGIVKYNLFGFCTKSHFTIRMLNMLYINKFGSDLIFTAEKRLSKKIAYCCLPIFIRADPETKHRESAIKDYQLVAELIASEPCGGVGRHEIAYCG